MPQLSDLRESGAIEQDSDLVMFLYRPEYYDITANELGESNKGETHIRIAKHRNGQLETIKLKALLHIQKFIEEDADFDGSLPPGGSWKPVKDIDGDGAKLYIQKGSKMNDGEFDDETPFLKKGFKENLKERIIIEYPWIDEAFAAILRNCIKYPGGEVRKVN